MKNTNTSTSKNTIPLSYLAFSALVLPALAVGVTTVKAQMPKGIASEVLNNFSDADDHAQNHELDRSEDHGANHDDMTDEEFHSKNGYEDDHGADHADEDGHGADHEAADEADAQYHAENGYEQDEAVDAADHAANHGADHGTDHADEDEHGASHKD